MRKSLLLFLILLSANCSVNEIRVLFFTAEFTTPRGVDCENLERYPGVHELIFRKRSDAYNIVLSAIEVIIDINERVQIDLDNRDKIFYARSEICTNVSYLLDAEIITDPKRIEILEKYLAVLDSSRFNAKDLNPIEDYKN